MPKHLISNTFQIVCQMYRIKQSVTSEENHLSVLSQSSETIKKKMIQWIVLRFEFQEKGNYRETKKLLLVYIHFINRSLY